MTNNNKETKALQERIFNIVVDKKNENQLQGLYSGNTGLCIYFYHLARNSSNTEFEQIADQLLDKVIASLNTAMNSDFESGLSGIGWGIEYLIQNGFAEGDSDDILEVIDDMVFRHLIEENISSLDLSNGLAGYLHYLIARLKKPNNTNSVSQKINRELLIHTINKVDELIISQFPLLVKDIFFDLHWKFPVLFYALFEAFKLNIYNEKIKIMIVQWIMNIEAYIPFLHINRVYLALSYTYLYQILPDDRLQKMIRILQYATDFNTIHQEIDRHSFGMRLGWPGVVWVLKSAVDIFPTDVPNHNLIIPTANRIAIECKPLIDKLLDSENQPTGIKLGLADGLSGFSLLDLLYPDIFAY